jgi:excisionase family DNA binding protein
MPEPRHLSVAQVADRLGITRQGVLKRIKSGRLPAAKVGRAYVVPAEALGVPSVDGDPVVVEIVRRLSAAYEPERIYLFGSAARGDTGEHSDYDVLLVVPDDAPPERVRAAKAYDALWGIGVAVDVVVWRRSAFDARAEAPTSLPAIVLREGVLLRAA